jgi:hypothetical protein
MNDMNDMTSRVDRLERMQRDGRLLRSAWGDGVERACLLTALAPEVGEGRYEACPASVMPEWFARMVPWIDDSGGAQAWPAMVNRFAAVARRWHVLTPEDWTRLEWETKIISVAEAASHTKDARASAACAEAIALCERAKTGDSPTKEEWAAAAWAVSASASAASAWAVSASAGADRITALVLTALESACAAHE